IFSLCKGRFLISGYLPGRAAQTHRKYILVGSNAASLRHTVCAAHPGTPQRKRLQLINLLRNLVRSSAVQKQLMQPCAPWMARSSLHGWEIGRASWREGELLSVGGER